LTGEQGRGIVIESADGWKGSHVHMNCSKLCSGFRQLFGETTAEFVRRQRLEFAHALLRTSDLQVQQIARRAGYLHHGSFTAAFTRQFGYSPKKVGRAD
jgi:AraC family transcriptional regulator, transcriptional activator of the genes for pyochelin and ferripyochelin receptors